MNNWQIGKTGGIVFFALFAPLRAIIHAKSQRN
jgi:hypothetical protein